MSDDPDPDILAAELALGLLEGKERSAALRRALVEPDFARAVDAWSERLQPLQGETPALETNDRLWMRIEAQLDQQSALPKLLTLKLRRWRATAMVSSAIAASLALVLVLNRPDDVAPLHPGPMIVAQLGPSDAQAVLLARYDEESGQLTIRPATLSVGGHAAELWIIPEGQRPRSLGLVQSAGVTRAIIPTDLRLNPRQGAAIAVSLEPVGGSPTGQPTGPIIASGKFSTI